MLIFHAFYLMNWFIAGVFSLTGVRWQFIAQMHQRPGIFIYAHRPKSQKEQVRQGVKGELQAKCKIKL